MIRTVLAAGLALALTGCATDGPPAGLSWYVVSQLNGFYDDIDDPTNRPPLLANPPEGVVQPIDVNADGVTDWMVKWPESTQFCGTGGCRVTVYLTHGQNLIRVFDRQAFDVLAVSSVDGEARLEGSFHSGYCGDRRDDCRLAWGLDPATRTLVARPSANGDSFAASNDVAPIDPIWAGED